MTTATSIQTRKRGKNKKLLLNHKIDSATPTKSKREARFHTSIFTSQKNNVTTEEAAVEAQMKQKQKQPRFTGMRAASFNFKSLPLFSAKQLLISQ